MNGQKIMAGLGCTLLLGYVLAVGFLHESLFGVSVKSWHILIALFVCACFIFFILLQGRKNGSPSSQRLFNTILLVWSVLIGLFGLDTLFTLYINFAYPKESHENSSRQRLYDSQVWYGELSPRTFQPTDYNFVIHKPNVTLQGETFGEFYESYMLDSPTIKQSVLQLRPVTFSIDQYGFRDSTPIQEAEVYVLGDSFVFGYGTTQHSTWVEVLEARTKTPLYNLGVSSTGPGVQYELFKYVMTAHALNLQGKQLYWMIYEGNDLENRYRVQNRNPAHQKSKGISQYLQNTFLDYLLEIPDRVKRQSVFHQVRSKRVILKDFNRSGIGGPVYDPLVVDGIPLKHPLYFSKKHGYRLFNPQEVERVAKPKSYILEHPNRKHLENVFRAMKKLSHEKGFTVVIILAPSAARAYGKYFEHFPPVSPQPYFLDYVNDLAGDQGFKVVNLLSLLEPVLGEELLYYRDDHHWNERGNLLVADLLQAELFQ